MVDPRKTEASELEKQLQAQFNPENTMRFSSTAQEVAQSDYVQDLVLPDNSRGRMPLTRDKFVVSENPARVEWERQTRKFLRRLNPDFSHRVTPHMIYEWATGIKLRDLQIAEGIDPERPGRGPAPYGSASMHIRHINWVLSEYFGKPYKTTIMGRPVGKAYTVRQSFFVQKKRPACLTLWPEWDENTLDEKTIRK